MKFSEYTAGLLAEKQILQSSYSGLVAFALTFLIIVIVIHLLARLLTKLVEAIELGLINRLAGIVFNGLKTLLIISIAVSVFHKFNNTMAIIPEEKLNDSVLYYPISRIAPAIFPYFRIDFNIKDDKSKEHGTFT
ncbi:MAG: CvpA family protein [Bacteroidales bacterium]|nr:CvpA family protein [Bacteroidales bacterium]